jgi:hypothetical protein
MIHAGTLISAQSTDSEDKRREFRIRSLSSRGTSTLKDKGILLYICTPQGKCGPTKGKVRGRVRVAVAKKWPTQGGGTSGVVKERAVAAGW